MNYGVSLPLERLQDKTGKEVLWIYILRLLYERDMYAYELKEEIKDRFNFEPATVTGYVVLYRLEREGYVEKSREEKGSGGSNRKYYSITPKGRELLKDGLDYLNNLMEELKIDSLSNENLKDSEEKINNE